MLRHCGFVQHTHIRGQAYLVVIALANAILLLSTSIMDLLVFYVALVDVQLLSAVARQAWKRKQMKKCMGYHRNPPKSLRSPNQINICLTSREEEKGSPS
ncbi:MAG: hypothetical protein J3R72DRAFT_461795 [Linnemannia gamsii]|nr:MAG: hypothetical protein J3R72DRAFT_461795 [Linnemannia gamsii]